MKVPRSCAELKCCGVRVACPVSLSQAKRQIVIAVQQSTGGGCREWGIKAGIISGLVMTERMGDNQSTAECIFLIWVFYIFFLREKQRYNDMNQ